MELCGHNGCLGFVSWVCLLLSVHGRQQCSTACERIPFLTYYIYIYHSDRTAHPLSPPSISSSTPTWPPLVPFRSSAGDMTLTTRKDPKRRRSASSVHRLLQVLLLNLRRPRASVARRRKTLLQPLPQARGERKRESHPFKTTRRRRESCETNMLLQEIIRDEIKLLCNVEHQSPTK